MDAVTNLVQKRCKQTASRNPWDCSTSSAAMRDHDKDVRCPLT